MGYQPFERKVEKRRTQPKEEHHMQAEWDAIAEEQWKRSTTKRMGDTLITVFGQTVDIFDGREWSVIPSVRPPQADPTWIGTFKK